MLHPRFRRYLMHALEDLRAHRDVDAKSKRAFTMVLAVPMRIERLGDAILDRLVDKFDRWALNEPDMAFHREHSIYQFLIQYRLIVAELAIKGVFGEEAVA
jgi:hypothetical protein